MECVDWIDAVTFTVIDLTLSVNGALCARFLEESRHELARSL